MRSRATPLSSVLAVLSLTAAVGCQPPASKSVGALVGVYAIDGALIENTCGGSALAAVDPLRFEVEIRRNDQVGYWQIEKQAQQTGEIEENGTFLFRGEQTSLVSSMRTARNDLEPGDFVNLTPDFDLKTTTCAMKVRETIEGTLMRTLVIVDGGEAQLDPSAKKPKHDLTGDNTIEVMATTDSDCSASLAAFGGPFANLPCYAHYALQGDLQESRRQ
jgi:hypothetical protein